MSDRTKDEDMSADLAVRDTNRDGLVMVIAPTEAEQRLRDLQEFVRRTMVEGEDYGVIPGTKGGKDEHGHDKPPKKTLYQPGAQKLAEIYGLAFKYEDERPPIERWEEDAFFAYFKRAVLTRRNDGLFLGCGVGSCNSKEEKYAGRWVFERDVPSHLDLATLRSKSGIGRNGKPYTMYRVPNQALFDLVNTIEKMACKRALVHAVIAVTRSAGIFTQDVEDMSPAARGEIQDADFEPAAARDPGDHNGHRAREPEPPPAPAKPTQQPVDPAEKALADDLAQRASTAELAGIDALLDEAKRLPQRVRGRGVYAVIARRYALATDFSEVDNVYSWGLTHKANEQWLADKAREREAQIRADIEQAAKIDAAHA